MNNIFVLCVIGWLGSFFISLIFHYMAYFDFKVCDLRKGENNKKRRVQYCSLVQFCKGILAFIFSIDLFLSTKFKNLIKERYAQDESKSKSERGDYIKRMNICNLCVSIFLVLFVYMVKYIPCDNVLGICKYILIARGVSRTWEINVAFFKDVTSAGVKDSNIKNEERIGLALKSLVEEAVLFSGGYLLIGERFVDSIAMGAHSLIVYLASYSIELSGFRELLKFVPIYQLLCSLVLVTFCLVSYIGNVKKSNSGEKEKVEEKNSK